MYVFYSRDIQNMKGKCAYRMLYRDQWSSLSLVRATRSWAQWQNCLSKGSHQSTSRDTYRLWQFTISPSKSPCFVTHLWFSVLWTQGSASPFKLTLLWAHLPHRAGHVRTAKGERPCISKHSCKSNYKKQLGTVPWAAKLLWKGRHGVQEDTWLLTLGQSWSQKAFPYPFLAFLASWIDLQHYCVLVL